MDRIKVENSQAQVLIHPSPSIEVVVVVAMAVSDFGVLWDGFSLAPSGDDL
jgi:hypothetical protein